MNGRSPVCLRRWRWRSAGPFFTTPQYSQMFLIRASDLGDIGGSVPQARGDSTESVSCFTTPLQSPVSVACPFIAVSICWLFIFPEKSCTLRQLVFSASVVTALLTSLVSRVVLLQYDWDKLKVSWLTVMSMSQTGWQVGLPCQILTPLQHPCEGVLVVAVSGVSLLWLLLLVVSVSPSPTIQNTCYVHTRQSHQVISLITNKPAETSISQNVYIQFTQ